MSIYTVNGSPVKHNGKFLTNGGTSDLPDYDSEDANKVLKVSPNGLDIGWYDDADTTYTAGNGLTLNGTEFSVDTSVVATQSDLSGKQDKLTAGQNITIDADNVISATGGGGSSYTAGNGIDITGDVISVDTSVVATQTDLSGKQDTLTAGTNIQINSNVISATDTTYTAGTGLTLTGTEFSADTTVLATQQDLTGKQDALTAGSNIQINNNVISATDTTYSAGTGIDITGTTISADTSVLATQTDLSGKQDTLTAGSNITIQNNVISATAAPQVNSDWTANSGVAEILHKPTEKTLAAGSNVTITEASNIVTISATDTTYTAGKGVVIDNATHTIRVDETVLFEDTGTTGTVVSSVVLSETSANFSTLEITLGWAGSGSTPTAGRLIFRCNTDGNYYGFGGFIGADASNHFVLGGISANGTTLGLKNVIDMYSSNLTGVTYQSFNNVLKVFKVVGISRIASA